MKKIIIASMLVVGLATGVAFAHNGNWGARGHGGHMNSGGYQMMNPGTMGPGMMGPGMMGPGMRGGGYVDCPGAAAFGEGGWNSETHQKFLEESLELRQELNDKHFAYREARRNPNTTREQLATIEKEMIDLRTKLQDKAEQYR